MSECYLSQGGSRGWGVRWIVCSHAPGMPAPSVRATGVDVGLSPERRGPLSLGATCAGASGIGCHGVPHDRRSGRRRHCRAPGGGCETHHPRGDQDPDDRAERQDHAQPRLGKVAILDSARCLPALCAACFARRRGGAHLRLTLVRRHRVRLLASHLRPDNLHEPSCTRRRTE